MQQTHVMSDVANHVGFALVGHCGPSVLVIMYYLVIHVCGLRLSAIGAVVVTGGMSRSPSWLLVLLKMSWLQFVFFCSR